MGVLLGIAHIVYRLLLELHVLGLILMLLLTVVILLLVLVLLIVVVIIVAHL